MKGANPGDVWEFSHVHYSNPERAEHPTQKPFSLMRWCVHMTTGTVLDPFMGSGTTGVACSREDVGFVGVERDPEYMAIARARVEGDAPLFNRHGNRGVR